MQTWLKRITIGLSLLYPFIVYWGLQTTNQWLLLLIIPLLISLRVLSGINSGERNLLIGVVIAVAAVIFWQGLNLGVKFYPVLMNLGFLLLFCHSLLHPPSMIERIARLAEPDLPAAATTYLRRVTQAWCIFFLLNGSIALATTLWGSDEIWLVYNGGIAYGLIGMMFAGEWLLRKHLRRD